MARRALGCRCFAAHALGGGEGDLVSYIERRGQLGRHRLPAQPVLPRQPGHAGGFRTQDVDPLPGRRRRHVGRVGVPGITGDQQRRAQAPARLMMLRPGHDFGGGDQHGLLERLPGSRLVAFRSCPPVDGQIDFIHAGVQRHQHGLARRGSGLRGHRQMRNHRQHRDIQSQGHALGHAAGHPQAGEPARPLAERHGVQRARGQSRLGQQFAGHGQQPLGVLLGSFVLTDGDVQPAVGRAQQGDAAARRRGFQSQQV